MQWVKEYQLFLFDFDGLLVDTEPLHFAAYREMCRARGFALDWSLEEYCQAAHFKSLGMKDALYAAFPDLKAQEPRWEVLYREKKEIYVRLLKEGSLRLMPGVAPLLEALQDAKIRCCVVTNSPRDQIEIIKQLIPLLNTIPVWLTREDYGAPKPSPEGYRKAIELLGKEGDRIIGFEDSLKGLQALIAAEVEAVLICPVDHPQVKECANLNALHFESLKSISKSLYFTSTRKSP